MTRLLLVRHGESTWNAVRRWQGQADPPLSERGEVQARRAAVTARLHGPFDAVATSHLQRARRTGSIIADELGIELLDPEHDLSERSAGDWEGLTRSEIERRYPGFLETGRRPHGYESDASIVERSRRALHRSSERHPGATLLVVSHGGIISALERVHIGDGQWRRLDNLTGRWFEMIDTEPVPVGQRVALVSNGGPRVPPPDPDAV